MKRRVIVLLVIFSLFIGIGSIKADTPLNDLQIERIYVDGQEVETVPEKGSGYYFQKTECSNNVKSEWNNDDWSLKLTNVKTSTACRVYFTSKAENANKNYMNPNTGLFLNIFLMLIIIGLSVIIIRRVLKNNKFFRL